MLVVGHIVMRTLKSDQNKKNEMACAHFICIILRVYGLKFEDRTAPARCHSRVDCFCFRVACDKPCERNRIKGLLPVPLRSCLKFNPLQSISKHLVDD